MCQHEFRNVQYVPVEQRRFQDIRIEFLTTEGLHIPFEDTTIPTRVVLHFRKYYQWYKIYIKYGVGIHNRTFSTMHPLEKYYLNQAGRGLSPIPGIGPIPLRSTFSEGMGSAISYAHFSVSCDISYRLWNVQVARSLVISRNINHRTACRRYIETRRRCCHRVHTSFNQ